MEILCLKLLKCETEKEIINLLKHYDFYSNPDNWKIYGDNENNYGTISNQQSTPEGAMVEKIVNSIDALLLRECKRNGINPESSLAPKSLKEAVEKYKDKLNYTDLHIYATGEKENPNYIIADLGEGQSPSNFENTLLSLNKSNKLKIPFVQGKFNMGSTGALMFCGDNQFQLIISKKDPMIHVNDPLKDRWAFTLIRRNSTDISRKNSVMEYLVIDNMIPTIKSDTLKILPNRDIKDETYSSQMTHGTLVKMYNYTTKYKSVSNLRLYYKLSQLLPNMPIPAIIYDRRYCFNTDSNKMYTYFKGNEDRLKKDIETNFPLKFIINVDNQEILLKIYLLKSNDSYKDKEGIVYVVNGQVHGITADRLFDRKEIALDYIKDKLLIYADVTNISIHHREQLFMANREKLRESNFKLEIEKQIIEQVKNTKLIKEKQEEIREKALKDKMQNNNHIFKSIQKVMKNIPNIASLFDIGDEIIDNNKVKYSTIDTVNYIGLYQPTFFKIKKDFSLINPKEVSKNKHFRIEFKTDAVNDIFTRVSNSGVFKVTCNDNENLNYTFSLNNGKFVLSCTLPSGIKVGDILEIKTFMFCSNGKNFYNQFYIRVISSDTSVKEKSSSSVKKKENNKLNLPNIIEIQKKDWENHGFDEKSVMKINNNDYFINIDNIYLQRELKNDKIMHMSLIEIYKAIFLMYGISWQNHNDSCEDTEKIDVNIISKSLAPMVFPVLMISDNLKKG